MENLTLVDPVEGGAVAARPGLVVASGSGGPSGSGSSLGATSATAARRRTPGRWKRIPRATAPAPPAAESGEDASTLPEFEFVPNPPLDISTLPPELRSLPPATWREFQEMSELAPTLRRKGWKPATLRPERSRELAETRERPPKVVVAQAGSRELVEAWEQGSQSMREQAKQLEEADEDLCETEEVKVAFRAFKVKFCAFLRYLADTKPEDVRFEFKPPSDTLEEHLTAEEMEMEADRSGWPVCPQARHFATLALEHYNSTKKTRKFEMARVLLSKCFTEVDGTTFAHVNFTAAPEQSASLSARRLFFAELMLIPDLQAYEGTEPMRVLHVCTIEDSCFGGCHEMVRDIKEPVRKNLDYDRCHACSERIRHPRGVQFIAGHNRTRMPYVSTFVWTYRSQ